MLKKKIVVLGKPRTGKTSMRSIIFANYLPQYTTKLEPTIEVEYASYKILGDTFLNFWDCAGQADYDCKFIQDQKLRIFSKVAVFVYVFDINSPNPSEDLFLYGACWRALKQNSPRAKIFCLLHKKDSLDEQQALELLHQREKYYRRLSHPLPCVCFKTSIWDSSLYRAWGEIVRAAIPNPDTLNNILFNFTEAVEADEVLLLDRATFLILANCERNAISTVDKAKKFEIISSSIRKMKTASAKLIAQIVSLELTNSMFKCYFEKFTSNTYVLVCYKKQQAESALLILNIRNAAKHFRNMEKLASTPPEDEEPEPVEELPPIDFSSEDGEEFEFDMSEMIESFQRDVPSTSNEF